MGRGGDHFRKEEIDLFLRQELPGDSSGAILRHLISGCPQCLALARQVILPGTQAGGSEYEAVFRRLEILAALAEAEIATERERATSVWAGLQARSSEQRLHFVQNEARYQFWGLYDRILDESQKTVRNHPPTAADLAGLALAIVDHLDPRTYGTHRVNDFRAAAWVALGNACRLMADFGGCEQALNAAQRELGKGTGDLLEQAHLYSVQGSFLTDIGELEQAVAVMERARRCCRQVGDRHREGRIVFQQAAAIGETDPRRGIVLARRALGLLDRGTEPYLDLGVAHVLAFYLNLLGETREAESILETHRSLYAQFPDPVMRGRLYRLEAWIARQKGELLKAEHLFREQRAVYVGRGLDFDLVLASLELAEILSLQTRMREALEILAQTYPVLESWGVSLEVLDRWIRVEKSVSIQAAEAQAFRDLADLLRRRWNVR